MQVSQLFQSMKEQGFVRLEAFYNAEELEALKNDSEQLIKAAYTPENLALHSVYPSDSTETRVSHALMLSEGESDLPRVDHTGYNAIDKFLKDHNRLLAEITESEVSPASRCMLNYQNYFSGSKPVGEHFDGEYLKTQRAGDGIEFRLLEGILPRYVAVLVIANENDGKGIEIVDNATGVVHKPSLNAGDIVIFDNVNLRHRVPRLENPRTTIGIRSFDHQPMHFAADESYYLGEGYTSIAEGWVSPNVDCHERMTQYMKTEWPALKDEYAHYF